MRLASNDKKQPHNIRIYITSLAEVLTMSYGTGSFIKVKVEWDKEEVNLY